MALDAQQLAEASAAAMWAGDKASQAMAIRIDAVAPGEAVLSMTVREDMVNGHGICHGGYLFALADSAFAFACNSQNHSSVGSGARIEYVAPAKLGERLLATARQLHQGRRSGVYDVSVAGEDGKLRALFRGNSHRIGGQLVEVDTGEALI